jgi:hypothetical protein
MEIDNPMQSNMESFDETHDFFYGEGDDDTLPCGHPVELANAENWGRCNHFQCTLARADRIRRGNENLRQEQLEADYNTWWAGEEERIDHIEAALVAHLMRNSEVV